MKTPFCSLVPTPAKGAPISPGDAAVAFLELILSLMPQTFTFCLQDN